MQILRSNLIALNIFLKFTYDVTNSSVLILLYPSYEILNIMFYLNDMVFNSVYFIYMVFNNHQNVDPQNNEVVLLYKGRLL